MTIPDIKKSGAQTASKVLIVDDDEMICLLYREYLNTIGVETHVANDGLVAKKLVVDVAPHLILCDVMMPDVGGIEFLGWLKSNPKTCDTPIIMITADTRNVTRREAMERGAVDFLVKPLTMDLFLERVSKALGLA